MVDSPDAVLDSVRVAFTVPLGSLPQRGSLALPTGGIGIVADCTFTLTEFFTSSSGSRFLIVSFVAGIGCTPSGDAGSVPCRISS